MKSAPVLLLFIRLISFPAAILADDESYMLLCKTTSSKYTQNWVYRGFTSLSQLHLTCDNYYPPSNPILYVDFEFSSMQQPVSGTLDLSNFVQVKDLLYFRLFKVKGFDLAAPEPFVFVNQSRPLFYGDTVAFFDADLKFYYNGSLVDADLCDAEVLEHVDVRLFSNMHFLRMNLRTDNNYAADICPYAFKNARFDTLSVQKMTNTLLLRDWPRFLPIKNARNRAINLNAQISSASFEEMYKVDIDERLFNRHLFAAVQSVIFQGNLAYVQPDLFKHFGMIIYLAFQVEILRDFFHFSDNKWMEHLFGQGRAFDSRQEMAAFFRQNPPGGNFFSLQIIDTSVITSYPFPEEDFCLFKYFPRRRAVATMLYYEDARFVKRYTKRAMTGPVEFLMQNNKLIQKHTEISQLSYYYYLDFGQVRGAFNQSEFERRLGLCNATSLADIPVQGGVYFNYYDFTYFLIWFEFAGPVVTFPILAAAAAVSNLLVILILTSARNKKEKLFELRMFDYILLNAGLNLAECLIYEFRLMSMCMNVNSVFCSSIRGTGFEVDFTVAVNGFLGETLKTASILTGLLFSTVRYAETSKTDGRFFRKMVQAPVAYVAVAVLVLSLLLSVSKIFEYDILGQSDYDIPNPFRFGSSRFGVNAADAVFYLGHYFVTDFLVILLNLIVDLKLVRCIKANLKQKYKSKLSLTDAELLAPASEAKQKKYQEAMKKKKSVENKANALIIANIVIYFFCRLPELLGVVFFQFSYLLFREGYCSIKMVCYTLLNSIEYMYMLSYTCTIVVCYKFNSNFQTGFNNFFNIKQKRESQS